MKYTGREIVTSEAHNVLLNNSSGIYTYCLMGMQKSFPHSIAGIGGKCEVYYVERNSLFAIVSNVSLWEFSEDILEKNITDVTWLAPMAKKHEEVIEHIMAYTSASDKKHSPSSNPQQLPQPSPGGLHYTPVVPLRFCTIYKNEDSLFQAILPYREKILQFLDYTADKAEWSLKVFSDKIVRMNRYPDKERGPSYKTSQQTPLLPGENYFLAKKMQRRQEYLCKVDIQKILKDIYHSLVSYTDRAHSMRCTGRGIHGKPLDLVMNIAFLIKWEVLNSFQDAVHILAEKYRDAGVVVEFSGPWPPYSFCPHLS